jgi:carbon monoxide dehydrogenase subunit G
MLNIESEISEISVPADKAFTFLSDMNNWKTLMPEQVTKWESSTNTCSFVLNGMATIGLKISETIAHSRIKISSEGKSPFSFDLDVLLKEINPSACTVQLIFQGEMNPMIRMMAEKPLTGFFNYLSHKMRGIQ